MIRFLMIDSDFAGQTCELPNGRFSLGRRGDNDIVVAHPTVSARHCEILVHGVEVIVRNTGSRNGVFVDEVEVHAQAGILHGQCLRLGKVRLRVEIQFPAGSEYDETTGFLAYQRWLQSAAEVPRRPQVFPRFLIPDRTNSATNPSP